MEPRAVPTSCRSTVLWGSEHVAVMWATAEKKAEWLKLQSPMDSRILPTKMRNGKRDRAWREAADDSSEATYSDWPIKGPRTAGWVMDFLSGQGERAADSNQHSAISG